MGLIDVFKKIEPDKKKSPVLHTLYDAVFTFAYTPNNVTAAKGVQIRDGMDLKRTMIHVVIAMSALFIFGAFNIGHQHFLAQGLHTGLVEAFGLKLIYGLVKFLPLFIVANVVGLGIEIIIAARKGHAVEEGFLVSGALIPLIMPPDLPLWILAVSVAFAVIIGKEAFGGTGMNIWNIALLSRVFVFFAYPTYIAGDNVWVAGFDGLAPGSATEYGFVITSIVNPILEIFGSSGFQPGVVVDGYSGATPLSLAYQGGWDAVTAQFSEAQMFWGTIPGSVGETSKPLIALGAMFLIVTGIASWRIMLSMIIGAALTAMLLNVWGASPMMTVPWLYQFYMGSFLFAMAFMATDPVTASGTNTGKWFYGFLIGAIGMIIRTINPAYPEGWMLSILFVNTFAPLIDHYVLQANITKRLKRA